ncbi:zinc finger FYVE domain-containing protein 1-like [Engraulis encrasicolus]|uniref:zinc finger FYVE domain-containing protein 1-like n=1 Tax=Engraulis encrasicolus TaxID=184585 RepID=UPI002FD109FD
MGSSNHANSNTSSKTGGNTLSTQHKDKDTLPNGDIHPPTSRGTVGSSGVDGSGGGGSKKGNKAGSNGSKLVSSQDREKDLPNGDIRPPATRGAVSSSGVDGDWDDGGKSSSGRKGTKTGGNSATTGNSNHANSVHANGLSRQQQEEESRQARLLEKVASFLLVDENEEMQVTSVEEFVSGLGCGAEDHLKVISIFGNIGEGKSHTLNHTLYNGREVFRTSDSQDSCTVGVWVAYDPVRGAVVVDTEGLHGNCGGKQRGRRGRLLLKVLALSDLVVYRTHADRLADQLFRFLLDASEAYLKFFSRQLAATAERLGTDVPLSTLGPSVVVFHETVHTALLGSEAVLQERFRRMGGVPEAFSSVRYCGVQTKAPPTDFRVLKHTLETQLRNQTTRAPRTPAVIYNALKALSERFSGEISDELITHTCFFPDEYFTCPALCLACGSGCKNSMNHLREGVPHEAKQRCRYSHHHDNRLFTCKVCYEAGQQVIVVPKTSSSSDSPWLGLARYAWSGYVIECPQCGVIFRSRQFWFGNLDPVNTVVRTEIQHMWPGCEALLRDNSNAAQRLLDGVSLVAQSVSELGGKPTRTLSSWITDQIAPPYWRPNALILRCHKCAEVFQESESKHHCRACGEGFCDWCSSKLRPVPERGWGLTPVRVCDACYEHKGAHTGLQSECEEEECGTLARKVGEAVGEAVTHTLGAVATAMDIPLVAHQGNCSHPAGGQQRPSALY